MHAAKETRKKLLYIVCTPSYNASSCHLLLNWKRRGNGIVALVISRNCTILQWSYIPGFRNVSVDFNFVSGPLLYMAFEDKCNFIAKFKAFYKSDAEDDVLQVFFSVHLCIYKRQLSWQLISCTHFDSVFIQRRETSHKQRIITTGKSWILRFFPDQKRLRTKPLFSSSLSVGAENQEGITKKGITIEEDIAQGTTYLGIKCLSLPAGRQIG